MLNPAAVDPSRIIWVNAAFTIGWRAWPRSAMDLAMIQADPRAGGFLLFLLVLAGLVLGIIFGSPIIGALTGTAAGIAVALLVWVGDRGRNRG